MSINLALLHAMVFHSLNFFVFTGYYIDNVLEYRAKYQLLVNFLKMIKLFFQEFCLRFYPQ